MQETIFQIARWLLIGILAVWAARRRSLTAWILVSMAAGAEFGYDWPGTAVKLQVLSLIFLRMIRAVIAPLLFATLVVGIAGHADLKQIGRMGIKALVYFEMVTTIALFIGLAAINISRAGVGVRLPPSAIGIQASRHSTTALPAEKAPVQAARPPASDVILHVFPENIAQSVAEGQILQIVVFSIVFGVALAMLSERKRRPMLAFCESLSDTMFQFTNIVMLFAPVGVGSAIAYTVGHMGLGILASLAKLLGTLYAALAAFLVLVLLPAAKIAGVPIRAFARAVAEPASIAFATTSSEAALPRAMESMEAIGVPRPIVAFVIPTGYSFNLDGTTLYLSLASMFVAQSAGMHLGFGQQVFMMLTLMLTSKGVAGVPRAALVILLATASSFHLPMEPILVLLGVDALMDMGRTSVNVIGNCLASAVVARWEGQFGVKTELPVIQESLAE